MGGTLLSPHRIISWNVNSVRKRIDGIRSLVAAYEPEVLCLQETKVADAVFDHGEPKKQSGRIDPPPPETMADAFDSLGFVHRRLCGRPGTNGVAIVSRLPFLKTPRRRVWRGLADCRHTEAIVECSGGALELHCFYVPSGGGLPTRAENPKLEDKFQFLDAMTRWSRRLDTASRATLVVGDLNIAYGEFDVWNHRQASRAVGHTADECEAFRAFLRAGPWHDLQRTPGVSGGVPADSPHYTWWSYRFPMRPERGWRLDYALASPALLPRIRRISTLAEFRTADTPSDHAPVLVELN